jgi:predicted RNA binding protein YcfA (HicA-like mRNA interferase family)
VAGIKALSSRELIKMLEDDGWEFEYARGDHHYFKHETKPGKITVPHPNRNMPLWIVRKILKQAGLE